MATKPRARKLCFDTSLLEGEEFDVQQFVASIRSKVSLSVLRDDLRANLEHLQAELVACVQHDFHSFVSLGPSISEVEPLVRTMKEPVQVLSAEVANLVESLDEEIAEVKNALERRAEVSARKHALETILRTNHLLTKLERLVKAYGRLSMDDDALRLAERIATTYAQLEYARGGAGNGKFVQGLQVRLGIVKRDVRVVLDAWLKRALFPKGSSEYDTVILARALGMYVSAGLAKDAETYFRVEVVVPFSRARLKLRPMLVAAERKVGKDATTADALECAVEETLGFLGEKVTPLVSLVESEERLRSRLDFVAGAVWPAIQESVVSNMGAAFSPVIPDVFHRSVRAGGRLYEAMEGAAGTDAGKKSVRESDSTTAFWRRWNLPVYFQLRYKEITFAFDAALGEGPVPVTDEAKAMRGTTPGLLRADVYGVKATAALVAALRRCWADDVFIAALAHRFVRLSLQLLARFSTWVRSGLAGDWKSGEATLNGCALVHADVVLLQRRVPAELAAVQRKRNTSLKEELLEELDGAFSEAVGKLAELLPDLRTSVATGLAKRCTDNLKPLRSILLTYPMSTKKAPTTHSQFVPKILQPVRDFVRKHGAALDEAERAQIVRDVVEQTASEYCDMATELLSKKKTQDETLRRLNIGRGGSAPAVSGVKDKIATQLCLDVDQFMVEIETHGVTVDEISSAKRLKECVREEEEEPKIATTATPTTAQVEEKEEP